jgi:HlyD family secretion protein
MTPEERRKAMEARLAAMSPDERQRFEEMRARRAEGGQGGPGGPPAAGAPRGQAAQATQGRPETASPARQRAGATRSGTHASGATTIDALFGPLPQTESRGRAWLYADNKLKPLNLRLGVSDGTFTEILEGEVREGQEVVTSMVTGLEPRAGIATGAPNANNPLMGPQRGRGPGGPGGGRGGG